MQEVKWYHIANSCTIEIQDGIIYDARQLILYTP